MGAKLSGSSGKKYAIEQNSDINVTPFVDVMLVLLIIFMVAAPLATQSLRIDLPPPSKDQTNKSPVIVVQVIGNGDIYVGVKDGPQAKVDLPNLVNGVYSAWGVAGVTGDNQKVSINAKPDVKYRRFMEVLNTLERAGISKVNLALEGA